MKICTNCNLEKSFSQFHRNIRAKDGLHIWCKFCTKEYKNEYYKNNKEKVNQKNKEYQKINKDILNAQKRIYIKKNIDKYKKYRQDYGKEYRKLNADKIKQQGKEYRKLNVDKIRKYRKQRRKSDNLFRFRDNVRHLITQSFKRNKTKTYKKQTKTQDLLGCTIPEFCAYLEKLFQPGMSFENHGKWHVDHRIPIASATTQEELEKLCHYTNLQPLWAIDNIRKGGRY